MIGCRNSCEYGGWLFDIVYLPFRPNDGVSTKPGQLQGEGNDSANVTLVNAVRGHEERRWADQLHRRKGLLQLLATPCFDVLQCHDHGPHSSMDLGERRCSIGICYVLYNGGR